jgi:hypothetical protein
MAEMNETDIERIYEMVLDLIEAIDPELLNSQMVSDRSGAIYRALYVAAGIPLPAQPTPWSPPDADPA